MQGHIIRHPQGTRNNLRKKRIVQRPVKQTEFPSFNSLLSQHSPSLYRNLYSGIKKNEISTQFLWLMAIPSHSLTSMGSVYKLVQAHFFSHVKATFTIEKGSLKQVSSPNLQTWSFFHVLSLSLSLSSLLLNAPSPAVNICC